MRIMGRCCLLLCLALGGCSAFGFLFERLEWLVNWKLDDMFDLSEVQEEQVEAGTEVLKVWLVNEGFPKLITDLSQARDSWQAGQRQQAFVKLDTTFQEAIDAFLLAARPELLKLVLTLEESNLEHFRHYNETQREDWFDYAESDQSKAESRLERIEDWFGRLEPGQQALVETRVRLYPDEYAIRIVNNDQWVEQFSRAVRARDELVLSDWLADPSLWWTPEYQALRDHNRRMIQELLFELLPTISSKQSERVVEKVEDWIENLQEVMPES